MSYLWSPLTPGYYDLAGQCSLTLVALLLVAMRSRAGLVPVWAFIGGAISVLLVVTKWSSVGVVVIVVIAAVVGLQRAPRWRWRYLGGFTGGLVAALAVLHVCLIPLPDLMSTMSEVSRASATGGHALGPAVRGYAQDAVLFGSGAVLIALPSVVATFLASRMAVHRPRAALALVIVGAVTTGATLPVIAGWRGGSTHGKVMVAVVLAAVLAALVPALRPTTGRGWGMVVVLFAVPFAQAGGSAVPLPHLAVECLSLWVALVLLLTYLAPRPRWTMQAVWANLAVATVAVAAIAGSTTILTPFNTDGYSDDTATVPALGLQLSPTTAGEYAALRKALAPYVIRDETPMLTLDRKAGLTYLLGGVPLGSTWTDPDTWRRTGQLIRLDCRRRDEPPAPPVLVVERPLDAPLIAALESCGTTYPDDYRELDVPDGPDDIRILVPR
jgi:hypothetical protein